MFQAQCDGIFRDAQGLLTCVHVDDRPLRADDLDDRAYNRPPYAGMGSALAWWRYEMTNIFMGQYLIAQAQRARCGDAGGLAAGRAMLGLLFDIYYGASRRIETGMFGKPIIGDGGMDAYANATETNADQMVCIVTGLSEFHPYARPDEQRRIEQMVVEIADLYRRHQYRMETRGRMAVAPDHAVHGNKPMLFMLLAHHFAPELGFYDEYLQWFEMHRRNPAVNATCMTYLQWLSASGQSRGDDEVYAQGVWNLYIDMIARLARMDPLRRPMFATRLRQWWLETAPFLREDGKVQWSMMVRPETRRWRPMSSGEIERGPYSCWWGAPVLFSGQWAATVPVSVAEHCPDMADGLRAVLLDLLRKTDEDGLAFCYAMDESTPVPANVAPGLVCKLPPVMWLDAYWRGRANGMIRDDD